MTVEELITLLGNVDPKFLQSQIIVEGWGANEKPITISPRGFLAKDLDRMGQPLVILR